jgi:hypothetical protein
LHTSSLGGEGGHTEPKAFLEVEKPLLIIILIFLYIVLIGIR